MIERLFGGDSFLAKTRALDAAALRQEVIAHNLANANTPNFKRQDVVFETRLAQALQKQNDPCAARLSEPIANIQPKVVTVNTTSTRTDGNNVDLELENVNLATNTLRFEVLSQSIAGYFSSLKEVIAGR